MQSLCEYPNVPGAKLLFAETLISLSPVVYNDDRTLIKGSIKLSKDNDKGNDMRHSSLTLWFISSFFLCASLLAAEPGNLPTFNMGENPLGSISEPPEVARVRVPIKITGYEQIMVQNQHGVRRIEHKALAPLDYNLRATINRTNHFYLSDWHIESVPIKWEKDLKNWKAELKFYKRYGQEQDLEEYVGSLAVSGHLMGEPKDKVYKFSGQARQQFQNKRGSPVLVVEVGQGVTEPKGNVAKSKSHLPQSEF